MKRIDLFRKTPIYILVILIIWAVPWIHSWAQSDTMEEVASLLKSLYVDEVPEKVLKADTIEDMIVQLKDPHTVHFTSEEYDEFINSMEMTFTGIGIYLEIVSEGVLILSTIEGSPAEKAGLKSGDIIIEADDISLKNISSEEAIVIIGGTEGTRVKLVIKRKDDTIKKSVIRKKIEIPTISGEVLDGHIGYIDLNSFAQDTPVEFRDIVDELEDEEVDSWIIDIRDNPGGYLDASFDIAGYFIGDNLAVQMKNKERDSHEGYALDHGDTIDEPVIFLVNDYSASASEVLSAAMKDYEKGILIGKETYGKGSVQAMYSLSDGSVLKMTMYRMYSPKGKAINEVGVAPDLDIDDDPLLAARLLLGSSEGEEDKSGYIQIRTGPNIFEIDMDRARNDEYWEVFNEILSGAHSKIKIKKGNEEGWEDITKDEIKNSYMLLYPDYRYLNKLSDVPTDKEFTIRFSAEIDMDTVNEESIELIDIETGERVLLDFEAKGNTGIKVVPDEELKAGGNYWLIVHDFIEGQKGGRLNQGVLCEVSVSN